METEDETGIVGGREGGSVEAEDTDRIPDEEVGLEELERGTEDEGSEKDEEKDVVEMGEEEI